MAEYWVTFVKRAGVTVKANSEDEAEKIALEVPESEYVWDRARDGEWQLDTIWETFHSEDDK